MRRLFRLLVLGIAAIALISKAALQEREVTLRFKFPTNQVRTYEHQVSGEMAMTMQVLGQEMPLMISVQGKMTETERVESVDIEMGSYEEFGKETVNAEWLSGLSQPYTIAFQHPYLMEFLSTLRSGEVTANFQEPTQAALWQPVNDDRWLYVVMPMHLPRAE